MSIITADDYKRVRIPDAKPGQAFAYELSADSGAITLTPVEKAEPRRIQAKLVRKGGSLTLDVPEGLELADDAIPRTLPR